MSVALERALSGAVFSRAEMRALVRDVTDQDLME